MTELSNCSFSEQLQEIYPDTIVIINFTFFSMALQTKVCNTSYISDKPQRWT